MNFIEAVKAMKEGNKVARTKWVNEEKYYWYINKNIIKDVYVKELKIELDEIEAHDWEIFAEYKDWNLANQPCNENSKEDIILIKKCRNLILKDITQAIPYSVHRELLVDIINKRFGALE